MGTITNHPIAMLNLQVWRCPRFCEQQARGGTIEQLNNQFVNIISGSSPLRRSVFEQVPRVLLEVKAIDFDRSQVGRGVGWYNDIISRQGEL